MFGRNLGHRETTTDTLHISIKDLKKWGYLKNYGEKNGVITNYKDGHEMGSMDLTVYNPENDKSYIMLEFSNENYRGEKTLNKLVIYLSKTKCNYGGYRYRFICPNCFKKYLFLYFGINGKLNCRKCLNLPYLSQIVSKKVGIYLKLMKDLKRFYD